MRILSDSGILLRMFEPRDPDHTAVRLAADALSFQGEVLVTAPQNMAEFWNVCTRPATARGGLGLSLTDAELRLQRVEARFAVLTEPATTYAIWRQLIVTHGVQGKQVHDARLVALMKAHGLTHIFTLNGTDFARYPGITVIDPRTFAPPPPAGPTAAASPPP